MKKLMIRIMGLAMCMLLFAGVAGAEKTDYKNNHYNFKNIKNVVVYDMDFEQVNIGNSILEKNLQSIYEEKAMKSKLSIMTDDVLMRKISLGLGQDIELLAVSNQVEADKLYDAHMGEYVDAYIVGIVKLYEGEDIYHPAYTTWETRTRHIKEKDSDGYVRDIEIEYEEPVYHPDYYTSNFYTAVEFHVYDAKTNEEIFSRLDNRGREDDEGKDMYARICSNFFSDFAKLTR